MKTYNIWIGDKTIIPENTEDSIAFAKLGKMRVGDVIVLRDDDSKIVCEIKEVGYREGSSKDILSKPGGRAKLRKLREAQLKADPSLGADWVNE